VTCVCELVLLLYAVVRPIGGEHYFDCRLVMWPTPDTHRPDVIVKSGGFARRHESPMLILRVKDLAPELVGVAATNVRTKYLLKET